MQKKFEFYSDPGHGWLKVSLALLAELNLIHKITPYSYMRKGFAYLEEDCDMPTFIAAYVKRFGIQPTINPRPSSDTESRIRRYDGWCSDTAAQQVVGALFNTLLSGQIKPQKREIFNNLLSQMGQDSIAKNRLLMEWMKREGRLVFSHVG